MRTLHAICYDREIWCKPLSQVNNKQYIIVKLPTYHIKEKSFGRSHVMMFVEYLTQNTCHVLRTVYENLMLYVLMYVNACLIWNLHAFIFFTMVLKNRVGWEQTGTCLTLKWLVAENHIFTQILFQKLAVFVQWGQYLNFIITSDYCAPGRNSAT